MRGQEILVSVHHTSTGIKEKQLLTFLIPESEKSYELIMAYCIEYDRQVFLSVADNTVILREDIMTNTSDSEIVSKHIHTNSEAFLDALNSCSSDTKTVVLDYLQTLPKVASKESETDKNTTEVGENNAN